MQAHCIMYFVPSGFLPDCGGGGGGGGNWITGEWLQGS